MGPIVGTDELRSAGGILSLAVTLGAPRPTVNLPRDVIEKPSSGLTGLRFPLVM
jgi:hypothetical protein